MTAPGSVREFRSALAGLRTFSGCTWPFHGISLVAGLKPGSFLPEHVVQSLRRRRQMRLLSCEQNQRPRNNRIGYGQDPDVRVCALLNSQTLHHGGCHTFCHHSNCSRTPAYLKMRTSLPLRAASSCARLVLIWLGKINADDSSCFHRIVFLLASG